MRKLLQRQIENAATGDRMIFIKSPLLGDGDALVFRGVLPAHAAGAPLHSHDAMTETFLVESGVLEIDLGDGTTKLLLAGDELTILPGTRHGFRNPLDSETRYVTTADPGAGLETLLRTIYDLGSPKSVGGPGRIPRGIFVMASAMARTDMVLAGVPRWLQRSLLAFMAVIAQSLGLESKIAMATPVKRAAR